MLNKGQVMSNYYRIMNKQGGYCWMQSCATLICNTKNSDEQSIICVNYVLRWASLLIQQKVFYIYGQRGRGDKKILSKIKWQAIDDENFFQWPPVLNNCDGPMPSARGQIGRRRQRGRRRRCGSLGARRSPHQRGLSVRLCWSRRKVRHSRQERK